MSEETARERMPRWAWAIMVGAVLLATLPLVELLLAEPMKPPPPEPLRRAASAVPSAPAPAPVPVTESSSASAEVEARRSAMYERPELAAPRPLPALRRNDLGIAPRRITRKHRGTSKNSAVAKVLLVATYGGGQSSAPVEIDGQFRGNTPLEVVLPDGSHAIRIDDGRTRVNQFVTHVRGGTSVRLQVELRPPEEARRNKGMPASAAHHH
jgi:hypothetical protein